MSDNISIKLWIFFLFAVIGGLFVSASFVPYCGDDTNLYSNLWIIKLPSVIIIVSMSIVTIVDLFGIGKKNRDHNAGKAFVAGLALGMTVYQIWSLIINSNCFIVTWPLPIPSNM